MLYSLSDSRGLTRRPPPLYNSQTIPKSQQKGEYLRKKYPTNACCILNIIEEGHCMVKSSIFALKCLLYLA